MTKPADAPDAPDTADAPDAVESVDATAAPEMDVPLRDPAPLRQHADVFAARLDVATLAAAGIPAVVIEPRSLASDDIMAPGRGGERVAVVMVSAGQLDEAREELAALTGSVADPEDARPDGDGSGDTGADSDMPFRPRGMPLPARIGLVVAVLMLLLGVAGAIATLFIGP